MKQENTTSNATVTPIVKISNEYTEIKGLLNLTGTKEYHGLCISKTIPKKGYTEYVASDKNGYEANIVLSKNNGLIIEEDEITYLKRINSKWQLENPVISINQQKQLSKRASR